MKGDYWTGSGQSTDKGILRSRSMIANLDLSNRDLENTLKKRLDEANQAVRDEETLAMEQMAARRRILDLNEWLNKKYSNLQDDYFYYSNKYEKMQTAKDPQQESKLGDDQMERVIHEKDHLTKLLNSTIEENEKLHNKLEGINLTQMIAPVLISKVLGIDPEEQVEKLNKELLETKNELLEERARNQEIAAERDSFKMQFERERTQKENLRLEEQKNKQLQRAEIDKLVHEHALKKLEIAQDISSKREKDSADERKNLLDRIEAMKARNEQFNQDNIALKRLLEEKNEKTAELEVSIMKLQNQIAELNSKIDLEHTEKEINLVGKQNANKQIEMMKRQIDELKGSLEASGNRSVEFKYQLDMAKRENEYNLEKIANLQTDIYNLNISNSGLERQM